MQIKRIPLIEMKELVKLATSQTLKQEHLFASNIIPLTYVEYYQSDIFKKLIKLEKGTQKIYTLVEPLLFTGGFNYYDNIIIFLNSYYKPISLNQEHQLIDLLVCSLHELGHSHQDQKQEQYNSFEQFCLDLEYFIQKNDESHYNKYGTKYLQEILADLYGITKTELFLTNYPYLYNPNKKYISNQKEDFNLKKITYDFYFIFEKFHKLNKNPKKSKISIKQSNFLYQKNSNQFKSISEIINNWPDNYGKTSLYYIFSTKEFIKQLNIPMLTNEELTFLLEAINYIYQEELEKKAYLDNQLNKTKNNLILQEQKKIIAQITRLKYIITILKLHQCKKIFTDNKELKSR